MPTNLGHRLSLVAACLFLFAQQAATAGASDYAVVVSRGTSADPAWNKVVETLAEKHGGQVVVYRESVDESLDALGEQFPRHACFVATPQEATREFVAKVHQLTRRLDDDPYTDLIWGILTGYDADNALRIAVQAEPLVIRRVGSGTEVALEMCHEGVWYCELEKNRCVRKAPGQEAIQELGPDDTTHTLVDLLNDYRPDAFVTSGHATERDWQIGFRYRNGSFRCQDGRLYGLDTRGGRWPVDSPNPKVYLPIGNCLMGHIDSPDAMALAWMNSAGVTQMIGYTVPTWFGYAGWGCLDYFVEQPGRYTFSEAFLANQLALVHEIETLQADGATGGDANRLKGLLFDRDVLAFYGDPAWQARMETAENAWSQRLVEQDGRFTFTIAPNWAENTFDPINTNGSQRGGRPIIAYLPYRAREVRIMEGEDLNPLVTDNFLLVPNPEKCEPGRTYRVVFEAKRM